LLLTVLLSLSSVWLVEWSGRSLQGTFQRILRMEKSGILLLSTVVVVGLLVLLLLVHEQ
jgi:hypothetical protein